MVKLQSGTLYLTNVLDEIVRRPLVGARLSYSTAPKGAVMGSLLQLIAFVVDGEPGRAVALPQGEL
jgi:hypothetical protein